MKKLLIILSAIATTGVASAQAKIATDVPGTEKHKSGSLEYLNQNRQKTLAMSSIKLTQGNNDIVLTDGSGTVKVKMSADGKAVVVLVDKNGASIDLKPVGNTIISGTTTASFMSADKKIGLEIKPGTVHGFYQTYLRRDASN